MFNSFWTKYIYIYIFFQPPNHIRKKHNSHSTPQTHHPTPHQTTLVLYGKKEIQKRKSSSRSKRRKPNPHIVFVFHFHNISLVDIMLSSPNNKQNPTSFHTRSLKELYEKMSEKCRVNEQSVSVFTLFCKKSPSLHTLIIYIFVVCLLCLYVFFFVWA